MKLSMFFLLLGLLQVSAEGFGQKITLNAKNEPVEEVLLSIEEQSGYVFFYDSGDLNSEHVSIRIRNASIEKTLEECFKDSPLRFKIVGKNVVISRDPHSGERESFLGFTRRPAAIDTLRGVITDPSGNPLPGAAIQVRESGNGTVSDENGTYMLTDIPENATLVFSMIGFQTLELPASGRDRLDVTLEEDIGKLNEVIVVGYGTKLKANVIGAISSVDGSVLENRPINNLSQGLQGVIPNLNVSVGNGTPGQSASLNIRGYTSINGGGPLVLVDGVQMDIDAINPNDVESISVLKDAASAAIYGARGAFGVVLVTTKSGKYGENARISYSNNFQFRKPTVIPDLMNSVDFVEASNIAAYNSNKTYKFTEEQVQWVTDYFNDPENAPVYHDLPNGNFWWNGNGNGFDEIVRDWSPTMRHDLTFQGGSDKTSMYASLGYMDQQGMFKIGNDKFKRYTGSLKARTQVADALSMGFQSMFTRTSYDEPFEYSGKGSYWHAIMRDSPLAPLYTPDYAPVGGGLLTGRYGNYLASGARNITNNLTALLKLDLDYRILPGLHLKSDLSYRYADAKSKETRLLVERYQNNWSTPQTTHSLPTFVKRSTNQTDYLAYNLYADYNLNLKGKHAFNLLLGFNQEYNKNSGFNGQVNDLLNESIPAFNTASGEETVADSESEWSIRGVFTRFNYQFDNKYLVEFSGRYDGTSRFPKESRFAFFPSVSAGWRISEENFMENTSGWLDNLMVRASYGSLGNQNVATYAYISSLGYQQQVAYIFGGQRPSGILPANLVSGNLTWETVTSRNIGLDVSLFGKLQFSGSYYVRETRDMLTGATKLPAVLGVSVPDENTASLETKGWDLEINWNDRIGEEIRYDVSFVLSDSRAWITKFNGNPNKLISSHYVGKEVGEIWGYVTEGIIQTEEQAAAMPNQDKLGNASKWGPGDVQYADLNGDGAVDFGSNTVDDPGDRTVIGNNRARYYFGTRLGANWKGVDVSLFFHGIGRQHYVPGDMIYWGSNLSNTGTPTYYVYRNAWSEEHRDAYYPIYKTNSNSYNLLPQSRFLENLAFIRLKNVTVGYSLPEHLTKAARISRCRVYVSGENLWEATKMRNPDFDPEGTSSGGKIYPFQRTLSFGIQLNL